MLSLGNAFSHDELRAFDARVRRGLGPAGRPGTGRGAALRRRAQDRRPGHHAPLRARPVRPGRDPRRRHDRRGRHGQPADDHGDPGTPRRSPSTLEARGEVFMPQGRVRADQRGARGGRAAAVRQPAQQRRGLAPPAGPGRHRQPAALDLVVPAARGRATTGRDRQSAALDRLAALGLPGQPGPRGRTSTSKA